jgi:hypothetical protein
MRGDGQQSAAGHHTDLLLPCAVRLPRQDVLAVHEEALSVSVGRPTVSHQHGSWFGLLWLRTLQCQRHTTVLLDRVHVLILHDVGGRVFDSQECICCRGGA